MRIGNVRVRVPPRARFFLVSVGVHGLAVVALLAAGPLLADAPIREPVPDHQDAVIPDEDPDISPLEVVEEPPVVWRPDPLPAPEPEELAEEDVPTDEPDREPDVLRLPEPSFRDGEIAIRSLSGRVGSAPPGARRRLVRQGPTRPPRVSSAGGMRFALADLRQSGNGVLKVVVRVTPEGRVGSVVVRSRSGIVSFDDGVVASVSQWRFEPARIDGAPVASEFELSLTPARPVEQARPEYPERAVELGLEGVVKLAAVVGTDGRVVDVRVLGSSRIEMLDDAAVEALRKWRFKPARVNGHPARCIVEVPPIRFKLVD